MSNTPKTTEHAEDCTCASCDPGRLGFKLPRSQSDRPVGHEVFGDDRTVWVNGADGMCLARFCPLGVDIHKEFEAQARGEPPCRYCTQGKTGLKEWRTFQTLVHRYYGIGVGDDLMPTYVREEFNRA